MIDISKNIGHKSSTRQQIKYYKSANQEHLISINIDEVRKKTGTISLLTLTYPQNNSTYYSKQKNKLIQKLGSINKKLKMKLKQLQITTSKSFINFNFNHTQYKEVFSSTTTTYTFFFNYRSKENEYSHSYEQKESKISYSSIPNSYNDNITLDSKMKNENSNSPNINLKSSINAYSANNNNNNNNNNNILLNENINNSKIKIREKSGEERKIFKNNNNEKNKDINISNKCFSSSQKTTLKIQSKKIYSSFHDISFSKSTMKLNDLKQTFLIYKVQKKSETSFESNIIEKENKKGKEIDNKNVYQEEEEIKKNNKTKSSEENDVRNIKNLNFEKSLFASPERIALILFILYATFAF